jgi:hypothetical protein
VTTDQPLPHDDIASGHGVEESVPAARRLKQRYDGRSKVTGTARYSADVRIPRLAPDKIMRASSDQAKSDEAQSDLEEPTLRIRRNATGKTITQQ